MGLSKSQMEDEIISLPGETQNNQIKKVREDL